MQIRFSKLGVFAHIALVLLLGFTASFSVKLRAESSPASGELIVASADSSDIAELLKGAEVPVALIGTGSSALEQLNNIIQQKRPSMLHLVAHGRAGEFWLGETKIDRTALQEAAALLRDWPVKRIALWSCEVGRDAEFIQLLARLTGAEVFSSAGSLGSVAGESKWSVVGNAGGRAPEAPFSAEVRASWRHTLARLTFNRAYAVNIGSGSPAAGKEANSVDIVYSNPLAGVVIDDERVDRNFSGNDVVLKLNIGAQIYYGWVSRPIKVGGTYRAFYFWTDPRFTTLAAATTDGNADSNGDADNFGFVLIVDQAWIDGVAYKAGSSTLKTVGSSSDPVDSALNGLIPPNVAPVASNDIVSMSEDAGPRVGNVLTNDTDANSDPLTVTQFVVSGVTYSITGGSSRTVALGGVGSITIGSNGAYSFTPSANFTGSVPAITYTISDGLLTSSAQLQISVTSVNDAPVGADKTITVVENNSVVLLAADFGFSDPLDSPPNTLAAVRITSLPAAGQLLFNGVAVTALQVTAGYEVTAANLAAGKLVFTPALNTNGNNYANFSFRVRDNGGTANGGVDLAVLANTLTFNVSALGNLSVSSATVNEASPFAVFTVSGSANQAVRLSSAGGSATLGTDFGSGLEYYNGTSWLAYTPGNFVNLNSSGTLLVRIAIIQDLLNEGAETFTLTASNSGGTPFVGNGTIRDDGQGDIYLATNTGGAPDAPTAPGYPRLDDDRTLTVTSPEVNEASPFAVFTVTGAANQSVQLALTGGSATLGTDFGPALEIFNGTTWIACAPGDFVNLDSSGTLLVRTAVTQDLLNEGSESFTLTATNTGGRNFNGTGTIRDDGEGDIYLATNAAGTPDAPSAPGYPRLDDDRTLTVTGTTVNEASPYAVFTVSGSANQLVQLALTSGTATLGSDFGPAIEYFNGSAWISYTLGEFVSLNGSGTLLVRTTVTQDELNEGLENFTLTATNTGGAPFNGSGGIRDDGQGVIFLGTNNTAIPNASTDAGYPRLDDDRTLTVTGTTVNEASPYAVFTVSGSANQLVELALASGTAALGTDFGPALEYFNGSAWVSYTASSFVALNGSGTLLVRTTVTQDALNEGLENFTLTATNSGGAPFSGTGGIRDDGQGVIFLGTNNTATPNASTDAGYPRLDDDRTLTVTGTTVNEASPYAVFTVSGSANQFVQLTLTSGTATLGTDFGPALEYFNGSAWVSYTASSFVALNGSGTLLVRTTITQDALNEGLENFTLTATNVGGAPFNGTGGIRDDGQGVIFLGTNNTATPNASTDAGYPRLDDDRTLTVTGTTVNEASPYAVFIVSGSANQSVQLALTSGTATLGTDFGPALEYFNGSAWVSYTASSFVALNGSGTLLVRTTITQDALNEGLENFTLTATNVGGAPFNGSGGIRDDGQGVIFLGTNNTATPNASTDAGYPRLDDDRTLTVTGATVNEASPYAVFTVSGSANQLVQLTLTSGTATLGTDFGPALEYFNGSAWASYTASSFVSLNGSGTLLVRTTVTQDALNEGTETFTLAATNVGGAPFNGAGGIRDDGQGVIFLGTNNAATPNVSTDAGYPRLDDDRTLTVTGTTVNEASPYAVFTVSGSANQLVQLAITSGTATLGTDFGPALEYFNGSAWVSYTASSFVALNGSGSLLVRTTITQDALNEGLENFTLTATNVGGAPFNGTGGIRDDGQGVIFLGTNNTATPNASTDAGYPRLDDDRVLTVSAPTVNEASPYAVFTVGGSPNQVVRLTLAGGTATLGTDFGPGLEYFNGTSWVPYVAGNDVALNGSGTLLVRTTIVQDNFREISETFTLTATNSGGAPFSGTGTIRDDGQGGVFLGSNTSGTPDTSTTPGYPRLDDDRALTVSSPVVNEASPFAVFTVTGAPNQSVQLALNNGTAGSADFGPGLQYFNGTSWVPYVAGSFVNLDGNGKLLVRTTIFADSLSEGAETFTLVASNTGGTAFNGVGTIRDDGQGDVYLASNSNGLPDAPSTPGYPRLDDDRALTVTNIVAHEALGYAVFSVSGVAGQSVSFVTVDGTAGAADYGPGLEYFDGANWTPYGAGSHVSLRSDGKLLVRTRLVADGIDEGVETFSLRASNTGGSSFSGTCRILDRQVVLYVQEGTVGVTPYVQHFPGYIGFDPIGGAQQAAFSTTPGLTQLSFSAPVVYTVGGNNAYQVVVSALDGTNEDQALFIVNVISPKGIAIQPMSPLELDLQSGLYKQRVRISNLHAHTIKGFVFSVPLPVGAVLQNSNETVNGQRAIRYFGDLAAAGQSGDSVEMVIEVLNTALATLTLSNPSYAVNEVTMVPRTSPAGTLNAAPQLQIISLSTGDNMIEWASTSGVTYVVEYSADLRTWTRVVPSVTANANRTQWIDNGLPKTVSHPRGQTRFYRVGVSTN